MTVRGVDQRRNDAVGSMTDGMYNWPPAVNAEQERIREHIKAGLCPWCNGTRPGRRGPWLSIAAHVSAAHGISAASLRRRAGLFKNSQVCSEEQHLRVLARNAERGEDYLDNFKVGRTPNRPRDLSDAAKRMQADKAAAVSPEARRDASKRAWAARSDDQNTELLRASVEGTRSKAASRPIAHHTGTAWSHGCRCETCRALRRYFKGHGPKPAPRFTARPCHQGCERCSAQLEAALQLHGATS